MKFLFLTLILYSTIFIGSTYKHSAAVVALFLEPQGHANRQRINGQRSAKSHCAPRLTGQTSRYLPLTNTSAHSAPPFHLKFNFLHPARRIVWISHPDVSCRYRRRPRPTSFHSCSVLYACHFPIYISPHFLLFLYFHPLFISFPPRTPPSSKFPFP